MPKSAARLKAETAPPRPMTDRELEEQIKRRVARLGGTWNGRRVYLDSNGNSTFIPPKGTDDAPV